MSALHLTARNYDDYDQGKELLDYSDYSECVTYCNQGTEYGDSGYGDWYYIPDEVLADGSRVIYFGTFGDDHSPGASYYTHAHIYEPDDEAYAEEVTYWESQEEFLPSDERWEVVVGNIGTVYSGDSEEDARNAYDEYCEQSQSGIGRAGGEVVTLLLDGDTEEEFIPLTEEEEEEEEEDTAE